jgi:hypothetical protein
MKKRETDGGRDGFCTLRPKSRWVLSVVVLRGEAGEEEKRNFGGLRKRRGNDGDGLCFGTFLLFRCWRGKTGALTTSGPVTDGGKF